MMSLGEIVRVNEAATARAFTRGAVPWLPTCEQRAALRAMKDGDEFPAGIAWPMVGDYIAPGWERVEGGDLFADTSGYGTAGAPALTFAQLGNAMGGDSSNIAYGTVEAGQFQAYVGRFIPTGTSTT